MVRHDEVGVVTDEEPRFHIDAEILQSVNFFEECDGIKNYTVADDTCHVRMEYS